MANPDGTVQVSPPTKSAFDQSQPAAKSAPAKSEDKGDKPEPGSKDHAASILDSIQSYFTSAKKPEAPGGELDGKKVSVNDAVEQMSGAIKSAPGNNADY